MVLDQVSAFFHAPMRKRFFRQYRIAKAKPDVTLVEPLTYMNASGNILPHFIPGLFLPEQLIVVCDTLDLPPGMIRIRKGGSSAGHNGLKSIIAVLGSSDFVRIYVGIGRPVPPVKVVEYVLSPFGEEREYAQFLQGVDTAKRALLDLIGGKSIEQTAALYNRKNSS